MENYDKIKEIGKGSYGVVWLVCHKKDKKNYVLKQIDLRKTSQKDIQSAQQEAKLLSKLKHPNIVSYKDSFESHGFLYIAMLYCEGGDLYTKIKQQNNKFLEETQVVEWFVQIAMALQYMHERHILHRDLKTQNIFLTKNKIIKVGDLGIARVLNGNNDMATTIIGTPYYMSPELFSNKPYNSKSDVWALGCCVYEMATLKHAFNAKDINSLVFKILRGKMPPMPNIYSKELIFLIESMLNADPKKRPSVNKILRDPYIRQNINSFLERTKARQQNNQQSNSVSVSASQESVKASVNNNNNNNNNYVNKSEQYNEIKRNQRYSSPNILNPVAQPSPPPLREFSNEQPKKPEVKYYNSNLYSNDYEERSNAIVKSNSEQSVLKPRHSSSSSSYRENGSIHSDSDGEHKQAKSKLTPSSSPTPNKERNISDNSPQRQQPKQPSIDMQQTKQRRSVRISSVVSDIENDQHIELVDRSSDIHFNNNNNNINKMSNSNSKNNNYSSNDSPNSYYSRISSASSSIDSNENKEHQNNEHQTPKIISKSPNNNVPSLASSDSDQSAKINQSARERRRQKLRLSHNEDNIESKPPLLKKADKIIPPGKVSDSSETDSKLNRPRSSSSVVSKSYGANEQYNNDDHSKEFPFKDSLKLIKNNKQNVLVVSKSEDLTKVKHANSAPNLRPNKLPPGRNIPNNKLPKPTLFSCESSSSSSSEPELEPEKAKLRQQEKDNKEVTSFINALNTTLNSLAINKPDSEIDEFEDVEEIDENAELLNENDKTDDRDETNSNEETLKPVDNKIKPVEDDNFKAFANMTMGTLGATKKMQERIYTLEKDCIDGIGKKYFEQAYEILENFRDEEIEPKLVELLGRKNFDEYVGKIWQLKFFKDSQKLSFR